MRKAGVVSALLAVLVLAGCTTGQLPVVPSPTNTPSAERSPKPADQLPKSGDFVSQGATTTGTVTIASISDDEFSITLTNFSTGPGDDLRLRLSPGELVQGSDGFYYVDGSTLELPGNVDPNLASQTFVYNASALAFGEFRSFTVYDYASLVAFGSAALE
jgi:hypothetical protein